MRQFLYLAMILVLCSFASIAQQSLPGRIFNAGPGVKDQPFGGRIFNPNVAMVFDSSGKLIYFPPAVTRMRKSICFETVVPATFIYKQIAAFRNRLKETLVFFLENPNITAAYYCFLRDTARKDTFQVEYIDQNEKKQATSVVGDRTFYDYLTDLSKAIELLDTYVGKEKISLADIKKDFGGFKHFPAESFMTNLFFNQYQIHIKNGTDSIKYIGLKPTYDKKNKCFRFSADCEKLKALTCGNCGVPQVEQLTIQLVRIDAFTQALKEWFEIQNKMLSDASTRKDISVALKAIAIVPKEDEIPEESLAPLKMVKPFFINWFWYTPAAFVIDPFELINKDGVKALQDLIKSFDQNLVLLRQQKNFLDSVLSKVPQSLVKLDSFRLAQSNWQMVVDEINRVTEKKKVAEKSLSSKSGLFPATQPKLLLNDADIVLSETKQIRPQIQFNSARKYRLVAYTKRQVHRVSELPDNEEAYVMVHNLDSSIRFKVDQHRIPFKDDEEFTQVIAEQIDKILNAGATSGLVANAEQFFKAFFPSITTAGFKGAAGVSIPFITACGDVDQVPAHSRLKQLAEGFVNNKLTVFYKDSPFTEDEPTAARFRTHTEIIKYNTDSPFKDSISAIQTVDTSTRQAFATNINVGKLRFVQITFGMAVTGHPVSTTSIDTAGGGFRVSSADNRAKAIAGFKLYPFQSYNRDRWLLPRYPLHRFSVFGGFEVLHPLDNFYAGGAYDIVPGLSFSAGKNFYLQTANRVQNNTVVETHRSYQQTKGLYYGVTVNPVLFVKFITLFFKSL